MLAAYKRSLRHCAATRRLAGRMRKGELPCCSRSMMRCWFPPCPSSSPPVPGTASTVAASSATGRIAPPPATRSSEICRRGGLN